MIIHVVQPGETIYSIANLYGVSPTRLILQNNISSPSDLVVGDAFVILFPEVTHIAQPGDTLESIANTYGISTMQLLRNNPYLSDREDVRVGDFLVISYSDEKIMEIETNGYSYPFIAPDILRKTLPFLTYLTIFNYRITIDGGLIDIDDEEIIQLAKEYDTAPIMLISTMGEDGAPDIDTMHFIVNSIELQDRLIDSTLEVMNRKGYYGLNISTPYILPEDRVQYVNFVEEFANRLKQEGYKIFITITPTTLNTESGDFYSGTDYAALGQIADQTIVLSYDWGYYDGAPLGAMPYDLVREFLDFIVALIPSEKISIGIPTIGYIAQLPFEEGVTRANAISIDFAVDLAREVNVSIEFDELTQSPYFQYSNEFSYLVWFKDARSIDTLMQLVPQYGFNGVALWNIMRFFARMWLVINSQYEIKKLNDV